MRQGRTCAAASDGFAVKSASAASPIIHDLLDSVPISG